MKTIILHKKEILYDVHGITDKVARVRADQSGADVAAEFQTGEVDDDLLRRWMEYYASVVKRVLSKYIVGDRDEAWRCDATDRSGDDVTSAEGVTGEPLDDAFVWTVNMPDTWNAASFMHMVNAAHAFIVRMILYEYYRLLSPSEALSFKADADSLMSEIKGDVNGRTGAVRRPLYPF